MELLRADDLVVLDGSSARLDEATVRTALAELAGPDPDPVKVLVVPEGPLDSDENRAYRDRLRDLREDVAEAGEGELVTVVGLEASTSGGSVVPSDQAEVRHQLSTFDPTRSVVSAIRYLRTGNTRPTDEAADDSTTAPVPDAPARADVEAAVQELRTSRVVLRPGAPEVSTEVADRWRQETGVDLRLLVLPLGTADAPPPVRAEDLAPAFPDEHVLVLQGRWPDLAGPDQGLLTIARDSTVSSYGSFLSGRQVAPAGLIGVLQDQVIEWTSGAVEDQATPTRTNPLAWLSAALPFVALALVVAFGVRRNRRRHDEQVEAGHVAAADLAQAAAQLPAVADGVLALDPLARTRDHSAALALVTTRYGSARRAVQRGDGPAALDAVRQARQALTALADELGVPGVPGALDRETV